AALCFATNASTSGLPPAAAQAYVAAMTTRCEAATVMRRWPGMAAGCRRGRDGEMAAKDRDRAAGAVCAGCGAVDRIAPALAHRGAAPGAGDVRGRAGDARHQRLPGPVAAAVGCAGK